MWIVTKCCNAFPTRDDNGCEFCPSCGIYDPEKDYYENLMKKMSTQIPTPDEIQNDFNAEADRQIDTEIPEIVDKLKKTWGGSGSVTMGTNISDRKILNRMIERFNNSGWDVKIQSGSVLEFSRRISASS